MTTLHFITPEYPPDRGGVGDYTAGLVAEFERRGETVHVWFPRYRADSAAVAEHVHPLDGGMSLWNIFRLHRGLNRFPAPRTLCLQYVPHGYGWKAMNLPFALWIAWRAWISRDRVETMFHEVAFPWLFRPPWYALIALVTRLMATIIAVSSDRIYVTIPTWVDMLRSCGIRRTENIRVLPVPSNIPRSLCPKTVVAIRSGLSVGTRKIVGHFGTYGHNITNELEPVLLKVLMANHDVLVLLLGTQGVAWRLRFIAEHPTFESRVVAFGDQSGQDLAHAISACDVMLQPYGDGASCRRTSLMAALINGKAVVTTIGALSEPIWNQGFVAAAAVGDTAALAALTLRCLEDDAFRHRLECAGRSIYEERFTVARTVDAMLAEAS